MEQTIFEYMNNENENLFERKKLTKDYNNIRIIKPFNKTYTQDKYFNFILTNLDRNEHGFINYSKHSSKEDATKAYNVFLKPFLIKEVLQTMSKNEDNFCYLDADCLAIKNCDKIFDKKNIKDHSDYKFLYPNGLKNAIKKDELFARNYLKINE